jgi:hypothetical protein
MDFCDGDAPWGHVYKVVDVLDFLSYFASLPRPEMVPDLGEREWGGLAWILMACRNTLEQSRQKAEQHI